MIMGTLSLHHQVVHAHVLCCRQDLDAACLLQGPIAGGLVEASACSLCIWMYKQKTGVTWASIHSK